MGSYNHLNIPFLSKRLIFSLYPDYWKKGKKYPNGRSLWLFDKD